jgi:putative ABC transport system ATP-binding protein
MRNVRPASAGDEQVSPSLDGAYKVLRRGLAESPELRSGILYTVALAVVSAAGSLALPVLVQQVLDRGLGRGNEPRLGFVLVACAVTAVATCGIYFAGRAAFARLAVASERALRNLRVRVFSHIHSLSIAEQTEQKRGVFVSRVTADVDTLSHFLEWSGVSWITGSVLILGTFALMSLYSWQLTLIVLLAIAPLALVLRLLQVNLLSSYDLVRTRVGETLGEISESVMGADVVRAYGLDERIDRRLKGAIDRQYRAQMRAMKFQAMVFPSGNFFGALAMGAVLLAGVTYGPSWGLSSGRLVAFIFLTNLLMFPLAEMAENFDQTQTAIAGWRKVLAVMDIPLGLDEPSPGVDLPQGELSIKAEGVEFSYSGGSPVLRGIDLEVAAGAHVAIVGETGCGKTTFAKLLSRLADPNSGRILVGGTDLREVAPFARRRAIRMVPQDGFLFDGTIRANVAYGSPDSSSTDVEGAFAALGLDEWVSSLPEGLDTRVGQRGEDLSAGEAQIVALARAQIAEPSVLILDEATSAIDPETERALSEALKRLAQGRTTVTIAHRLSTAEAADWVFVFDQGRLVEQGVHAQLVALGGRYSSLYESWLGNTRAQGDFFATTRAERGLE